MHIHVQPFRRQQVSGKEYLPPFLGARLLYRTWTPYKCIKVKKISVLHALLHSLVPFHRKVIVFVCFVLFVCWCYLGGISKGRLDWRNGFIFLLAGPEICSHSDLFQKEVPQLWVSYIESSVCCAQKDRITQGVTVPQVIWVSAMVRFEDKDQHPWTLGIQ